MTFNKLQKLDPYSWIATDIRLPSKFRNKRCKISLVRPFMAGGWLLKTIDDDKIRLGGNGNKEFKNINSLEIQKETE